MPMPNLSGSTSTPSTTASPTYVTPRRAGQIVGVSEATIRNWIKRGLIPAYRLRSVRGVRVDRHEVARFVAGDPEAIRPGYGSFGPDARIYEVDA